MQKIYVKKFITPDNKEIYAVPALPLKNADNTVKLTIPHPMGTVTMEFNTLEDTIAALKTSGFDYVLPDGVEPIKPVQKEFITNQPVDKFGRLLYKKIAPLTENFNVNVSSAALQGLSNLDNRDAIEIFLEKMGEDNEAIRTSAINGLIKYGNTVIDKLIDSLTDENWVTRNSAITCISQIADNEEIDSEKILVPLINRMDDTNPIVQSNAIITASKIYKNSKQN